MAHTRIFCRLVFLNPFQFISWLEGGGGGSYGGGTEIHNWYRINTYLLSQSGSELTISQKKESNNNKITHN